jgi:hypothetical protein
MFSLEYDIVMPSISSSAHLCIIELTQEENHA